VKRRQIALRTVLLGISLIPAAGCGEADCQLSMPLSGDIEALVDIASTGQNFCSSEKMSGIVVISIGRSDRPVGFTGVEGLNLSVNTSKLAVGSFPTNVYIAEGTRAFATGDYSCTLQVVEYELENWTVTDYHRFAAVLTCPNPVSMAGGGGGELIIGPTQIEGYMLDE
jgi:hypothetical protein